MPDLARETNFHLQSLEGWWCLQTEQSICPGNPSVFFNYTAINFNIYMLSEARGI